MKQDGMKLVLSFSLVALLAWGILAFAETPTAPLNGSTTFSTASAPADTLKANAGKRTIQATDAVKLQGSPNSRISHIANPGTGVVDVADVVFREGDSFYHVSGIYLEFGTLPPPGGPFVIVGKDGWTADYNNGRPRVVLQVNDQATTDNFILPVAKGATLTVKALNCDPDRIYHIALSKESGDGDVAFSEVNVDVRGNGYATVDLKGVKSGIVALKGTCPTLEEGKENAVVSSVLVEEVEFGENSGTGKIYDVRKDATGEVYPKPHWKRDREASPVCYEGSANTKMKLKVKLKAQPGIVGDVYIRGKNGGSFEFVSTKATIDASGYIEVSDWVANNPFAAEVDIFDPMTLEWEASFDNSTWELAGKTSNQVYVTLGKPTAPEMLYHTLVHLGCRNADGKANNAGGVVTEAIWSEFTDKSVCRVDGKQMTYYNSYTVVNTATQQLLADGDGQCGSWAHMFIDVLKCQGIDQVDDYIIFKPRSQHGFLVKNWNFTTPIPNNAGSLRTFAASFPPDRGNYYLMLPEQPFCVGKTYRTKYVEGGVADQDGIPGQGNSNPASVFGNHQIVKIGTDYYDPSYGVKYPNFAAVKGAVVAAFWQHAVVDSSTGLLNFVVDENIVNMDLDGDGVKSIAGSEFYRIVDAAADSLAETVFQY